MFGEISGPFSYVLTVGGTAGCAWAWLFSRALFRSGNPIQPWTLLAVGAVIAIESYWALAGSSAAGGFYGEFNRVAANAASLICIAALVLVIVEAFSGYGPEMNASERRFRHIFVGVFGAMVFVAMAWTWNADGSSLAARWEEAILTACATVGLIGSRLAIAFRNRHTLSGAAKKRRKNSAAAMDPADKALSRRIQHAVADTALLTTPNLKVANFAEAVGEQDYKVTQCITGALQYRNFNHFLNVHRVEYAKRILADPEKGKQPILSIAFECGFNSIGPFNRAFKQNVGMTPREFRSSRMGTADKI